MPTVVGFTSESELNEHFSEHGHEFGATTAAEYLRMAKAFFERDLQSSADLEECIRVGGLIVRFDKRRDHFGVMTPDGHIVTFFIPVPSWTAPIKTPARLTHTFADNYAYFRSNCGRV
ncbi:MAG: hypothetical protein ACLQVD_17965 [Capsulimonadaceae bacterium]